MYEISKINDDGTKTVVGSTDLNLVSIGLTYDLLENKVTATLDKYMESRDLKSEDKIKLLSTTIGNIVTQSMSTVELEMKVKLLDAQIENERADISLKNAQKTIAENQSTKDLLIKDQQELAEKIKNGGLYYTYTYDDNGNILTKTIVDGTTKSIYEVQKEVEEARVRQVDEEIAMKEAQNQKDLLIKDQQELAEKLKNGGLYYTYTYNQDGSIATKTLENGTTKSIHELDKELKEKQIEVSIKQIEGFLKDMFFKAGGISKELLYMLAQAGATEGYEWNADVIKIAIEKMTDGAINLKKITGDNPDTTAVETSHTQATYDGDGTPNIGLDS